jgi:hypothetical protein
LEVVESSDTDCGGLQVDIFLFAGPRRLVGRVVGGKERDEHSRLLSVDIKEDAVSIAEFQTGSRVDVLYVWRFGAVDGDVLAMPLCG